MNMLSGAHSWGAWQRADTGIFDFSDLTFKRSGVTSKGLNKYRRGGKPLPPSSLDFNLLPGTGWHSGRVVQWRWDVGRLQSPFKNQQIKKEGARGEGESWHWGAAAPRHFGSMYRVLLMGLNETITALLLIAFVFVPGINRLSTVNVNVFLLSRVTLQGNDEQHTALGWTSSWTPVTEKCLPF